MNNFEVVVGPQNPNHLGDIRQANIRCHAVGISEGRFQDYCLPNSILSVLQSSSMLAYRLVQSYWQLKLSIIIDQAQVWWPPKGDEGGTGYIYIYVIGPEKRALQQDRHSRLQREMGSQGREGPPWRLSEVNAPPIKFTFIPLFFLPPLSTFVRFVQHHEPRMGQFLELPLRYLL